MVGPWTLSDLERFPSSGWNSICQKQVPLVRIWKFARRNHKCGDLDVIGNQRIFEQPKVKNAVADKQNKNGNNV
jgi:hypothetical protein